MTGVSFREAARDADRGVALRALRDLLVETLAVAESSNVAALAKQLRETMAELAALPEREGRSASDDLAAVRAARLANAKVGRPSVGGGH